MHRKIIRTVAVFPTITGALIFSFASPLSANPLVPVNFRLANLSSRVYTRLKSNRKLRDLTDALNFLAQKVRRVSEPKLPPANLRKAISYSRPGFLAIRDDHVETENDLAPPG